MSTLYDLRKYPSILTSRGSRFPFDEVLKVVAIGAVAIITWRRLYS